MTSIRRQLAVGLVGGMLGLGLASGSILYLYIRHALIEQFDDALRARAQAVAGQVMVEENGSITVEMHESLAAAFVRTSERNYFELWDASGTVLARSALLGHDDLPRIDAGAGAGRSRGGADLKLPDGSWGRGQWMWFSPRQEEDEQREGTRKRRLPTLLLVVAQDRAELAFSLRVIGSALMLTSIALAAGILAIVTLNLRRGLRPLHDMGEAAAAIDARELGRRFEVDSMPQELQPVSRRLNDLLARLETAFAREKRFTADVAHELRTRIAEVRTTAEVALKWPEPSTAARQFSDILDAARQMERTVGTLLSLARCQAGRQTAAKEPLDLGSVVRDAWRSAEPLARSRGLQVRISIPPGLMVFSDAGMLGAIVLNLLQNAAQYTPPGGSIVCEAGTSLRGVNLLIENDDRTLTQEDVARLFEPFWRKDTARSDDAHAGLGLSLAAAYARSIGAEISAARTLNRLRMSIDLQAERAPAAALNAV